MPKEARGSAAKKNSGGKKSGGGKGGNGLRWLWLTVLVFLLDLITKVLASYYLTALYSDKLTSFFNLVLVHNTGAAFGFLADASGWQWWLFILIAIAVTAGVLYWLWKSTSLHAYTAAALSLILAGALGNLFDRLVYGYVIDFMDFHYEGYHWPAFNVADSAICIGVVFFILSAFRKG